MRTPGAAWLLRPVERGLCDYLDLKNGKLDLADVARLNDYLDVRDENERRAQKAAEKPNV